MKIAVVAPFEEPVPPAKYGGTELVIYNITENLIRLGHEVTLLATGDSQTRAQLKPIFNRSLRAIPDLTDLKLRESYKLIGTGRIAFYLNKNHFDIVHNHLGWRLLPFQELFSCPTITTLHGPLDIAYQQRVYGEYKTASYVSISLSQRRPMPDLNYIANVYNGIDTTQFSFFPQPQDYFAFLGRMSPEKGPVQAIQIAKQARVRLVMAAKIDAVDQVFFTEQVKPLIDGQQIQFIGEVDHAGKVPLLGNARALIAPIQWEEPFGLFFIEAMATGTPVITLNRGSVPEIIVHGKTGYIVNNIEEMVAAVGQIDQIDRKVCRAHVEENFTSEKMAEGYEQVYQMVLGQSGKT